MREIELLGELVAIRTENPPGGEEAAARWAAEFGRKLGLQAEVFEVAPGRCNARLLLRGRESGAPLWLCGHLDTVPAGDGWKGDPFSLRVEGERAIGRGACDMKGGIACMLAALGRMALSGERPARDTALWLVADEECDGLGTKAALQMDGGASLCAIGEPTHLAVCHAHRGVYRPKITFFGKSCHAGEPEKGVNALWAAAGAVMALPGLLRGEAAYGMRETAAATRIAAGEKDNVVPGRCELVLDWRILPGDGREALAGRLDGWLGGLLGGSGVRWEIEDTVLMPAAWQEPLPGMGEGAVFGACSDMPLYLAAGIPTVLLGPGGLEEAHRAEESVPLSELSAATEAYMGLMRAGGFTKG